ncbi:MAG: M28 family peptidase [Acidobacteria bacterium]|nr:MAG: M28 family peptidase [Acidobacteriota bacterium]
MKRSGWLIGLALIVFITAVGSAQMTTWFQWTYLPQKLMDEIIGESSGETAFNHVVVMGANSRDRKAEEYAGTLMESQYVLDQLKSYGVKDAEIARFPGGETWDGVRGELWEVEPIHQKLASYTDLRAMLAEGSNNADVTAELIWVGEGRSSDLEGKELAGKIVVTTGQATMVHNIACQQKDAAGVISIASPRGGTDPFSIPFGGIRTFSDKPVKFAFNLPPREGALLQSRLARGQKIKVHAVVESGRQKYDLQDPTCSIPGTEPGSEEIILSAHLFEGYVMQGANDNYSGCAAILEAARTLHTLVESGRLPRPRRTIRFLWAPEFSGTIPWVSAHPELMKRTLCNINLDMVGLQLSKSLSFLVALRTTYGNPHYVNDVLEHYYRYVSESNRNYIANRYSQVDARRMVAPTGTEEPLYYYIATHFGSSDHEVFNDWGVGVPAVMMNNWPDLWYHSSGDRPDKLDPTQLKRAVIIAAATAYTIAAADDGIASQIAGEIVSNASGRLGHQLGRGIEEVKRADQNQLPGVYRRTRGYIQAAALNERNTLDSVIELSSDKARMGKHLSTLKAALNSLEEGSLKALEGQMRMATALAGTKPVDVDQTPEEKKASGIVPRPTPKIREKGYRGYRAAIDEAAKTSGKQGAVSNAGQAAAEIQLLCNGKNSALDMKKMLDTQFTRPTELDSIVQYLEILKVAGLVDY